MVDVELPVNVTVGTVQVIEALTEATKFAGKGVTKTSTVVEEAHTPFAPITV